MTPTLRVIRAAAGSGKTTALARAYLELVADGVPVEQIVAITFTRRAAAELVQRVGLALRAATGDTRAVARLGPTAPLYLASAPHDPARARQALADLGSAPIGTTDHFVNQLLSEFALDAELPLPDRRTIPLDTGLLAVPDLSAHLEASARRLLDPPDADPPDELALLTRYLTLAEIVAAVARTDETDGLRAASCAEVLGWLARRVAERLTALDLPAVFRIAPDASPVVWREAVEARTNQAGRWAVPAVVAWLADGAPPDAAPMELVPWIRAIHRGRLRPLRAAIEADAFEFGITEVRMDQVLDALSHPYEDPEHLALADRIRAAIDALRVRVVADALEQAAFAGELPHRELTRAAAHLVKAGAMVGRFQALLVDEFQDASPDQLALYEAMSELPGMRSVFVGDGRQSIYLFRGGEPEGLNRLTTPRDSHHTIETLTTNRRSTPELVEAHRALFAALDAPMRRARYTPLEALDALVADPDRAIDALDPAHHPRTEPVLLVGDAGRKIAPRAANDAALSVFLDRVRRAWGEPGHGHDTAAVLCATWRDAIAARDRLRALADDPTIAWVDGGDGWVKTGVARDLALWLRALLDRTDDIAWLAVWKHPGVGLSDAAFARVRAGVGLVPDAPWRRTLGQLASAERLDPPHRPQDIAAFARAVGPIREAIDALGRDDTSLVLDRLVTALDWRTALAAGPGGLDEVARLDVLLDWIGELDAQGAGVDAIAASLGEANRMEVPRVRLERPERTITCTTVFQAKGLAWDHVALLSPGRAGRLDIDPTLDAWMQLGGERVRLLGLTFDPEGGLVPYPDPLRRLAVQIHATRYAEEGARLAYVGLTRARRSVVVGLASDFRRVSAAQKVVATAWARVEHPSVARVPPPPEPAALPDPPARMARPAVDALPRRPADPFPTWEETAPSAASARYSRDERDRIAQHVLDQVRLGGFRPGLPDLPPPRDAHPTLNPADWGTLAHGWFASWRFAPELSADRAAAWLASEWGKADPAVVDWLLAVSARLAEVRGPVWDWVHEPGARLHFEYPLIGVGGPDDRLLLSGRVDLLIERKRSVVVVDFKAGDKSPTALFDLVDGASLASYGPQLDAYRGALARMGLKVDAVALWFVRTGASVTW